MLKPRDIANVEFRTAFRGYHQDDVDEFVRKIVAAYEDLYQENTRLEEHAAELKQRIAEYSQTEIQIDETLSLARQTAADAKAAAEDRARAIVAEAKIEAEEIVRRARLKAEEYVARARELTRQERAFRERFRDLLESYWALLEEERRDAEQLAQSISAAAAQVASTRWEKAGTDLTEVDDNVYDEADDAETTSPAAYAGHGGDVDEFEDRDDDDYRGYDGPDEQPTRRMDAFNPDDGR